jgi:hypothetical protein
MRFTDLIIAQPTSNIQDDNCITVSVNIEKYLKAIENYYAKEKPEIYKVLNEKGLFDAGNYGGLSNTILDLDDVELDLPYDQLLKKYELELTRLEQMKQRNISHSYDYLS